MSDAVGHEELTQDEWEVNWAEEAQRRIENLESGKDPGKTWEQVNARLDAKFGTLEDKIMMDSLEDNR